MYKTLLSVLILFFTFSVVLAIANPAFASVSPTTSPTQKKKFTNLWQLVTLKKLLVVQDAAISANPPRYITATPTPTLRVASLTPTKTQSMTITPTLKTTTTQNPTAIPTNAQPTAAAPTSPAPDTSGSSDVKSFIMSEINKYRASLGLSAVSTSSETCNFAKTRAQEISTSFTHDGFTNRKTSKTLPYAKWSAITENIAMTSEYKDVVNMWINSPGHAANMRADTPYVCVEQYDKYFAYEGMKP